MTWVYFTVAWCIFYLLHSLLTGEKAKNFVKKYLPFASKYYRLGYNLFFVVLMGLLIYWTVLVDSTFLFPLKPWVIISGTILIFCGIISLFIAGKNYDLYEFAGLPKPSHFLSKPNKEKLVITGFNKWVRHPLYFSLCILYIGFALVYPTVHTWTAIGISFTYLPFGVYFEEKKLIEQFGEPYKTYQKTTPLIFPTLRNSKKNF
ncbi:MAG: isoprenylcysteine carboxylmethyltransferase family protein [Flavobacteriales bacterium]|nr:isoprenylcysteine carboxylmethyltransferase family protein [Flavobacteriales bacterium]